MFPDQLTDIREDLTSGVHHRQSQYSLNGGVGVWRGDGQSMFGNCEWTDEHRFLRLETRFG